MIDKKYPENTSTVSIRLQPKKLNNWELLYGTKKCVRDSAKTLLMCLM